MGRKKADGFDDAIALFNAGWSNKRVADHLKVSISTVKRWKAQWKNGYPKSAQNSAESAPNSIPPLAQNKGPRSTEFNLSDRFLSGTSNADYPFVEMMNRITVTDERLPTFHELKLSIWATVLTATDVTARIQAINCYLRALTVEKEIIGDVRQMTADEMIAGFNRILEQGGIMEFAEKKEKEREINDG